MKLIPLILTVAFGMSVSIATGGAFYKYTDEKGHVHYTDDLTDVPESQRTAEAVRDGDKQAPPAAVLPSGEPPAGDPADDRRQAKAELDRMREILLEAYRELTEKRNALGDPPPEHAKSGKRAEYIRKSEDLNRLIREYNRLSEEFERKVQAYNRYRSDAGRAGPPFTLPV